MYQVNLNQTSPDFRAIIVCHKKQNIEFNHPHITYIEVDLPPPNPALKNCGYGEIESS
ncbi:hypothetical protein NDA03_04640 [Trichocoleus sp. Lan]|uniref:hypothetical protein n=1 Tax=Trichocoleus sp. Lan TaxID=2933927 RepID=UPI003297CAC1